jgi:hypothetical protein
MTKEKPLAWRWFALFAVLFALQVAPRFGSDSLVNDEATEVVGGYAYWVRGETDPVLNHGPFAMALKALPLLPLRLDTRSLSVPDQEGRTYAFVFRDNLPSLGVLTVLPRAMTLAASLVVGLVLFLLSRRPRVRGLATLALWAFEPTLLAHSGVAMGDAWAALFLLLAVTAFRGALARGGWAAFAGAGVVAGMAAAAKWSNLALLPVALLLGVPFLRQRGGRATVAALSALTAGFLVWFGLLYLPGTFVLSGRPDPWTLALRALHQAWEFSRGGYPAFFMGRVDADPRLLYFPTAFLLKSTLPFLLFLALGAFLAATRRAAPEPPEWMVPAAVFLSLLPMQNLGVRYLLPAHPFLLLLAGRGAAWALSDRGKAWRTVAVLLLSWHAAGVAAWFPHHLGYFNDLVPRERRAHLLADSNLDWGQDHKRLARVARERGWRRVKLAYFGGVDPHFYGLDWRPWARADLERPRPGTVYAVNVSFLQMAPAFFPATLPIARGWLCQEPPTGRVADAWYYFEVPGDPAPEDPDAERLPSAPFLRYSWGPDGSMRPPVRDPGGAP